MQSDIEGRLTHKRDITKGCTRSTQSGGCEVVSFSFVPGDPNRYVNLKSRSSDEIICLKLLLRCDPEKLDRTELTVALELLCLAIPFERRCCRDVLCLRIELDCGATTMNQLRIVLQCNDHLLRSQTNVKLQDGAMLSEIAQRELQSNSISE